MSPASRLYDVTLEINSTAVDDDTLQRFIKQVQDLLNDKPALSSQLSTTTVFQTILATVTVTDVRTLVMTATKTAARTVPTVPSTTFLPTKSQFRVIPTSSTANSSSFSIPSSQLVSSSSTSLFGSASNLSTVLSPTWSTVLSSVSSTALSSTSSTTLSPTATASANLAAKKGLPPGGIVGIVLACILFFLFPVIYVIRWRLRRKRRRRRSWITPFVAEKPVIRPSVAQRQDKRMEYLAERWQRMLNSQKCGRNRGAAVEDNSLSGPNDVASHRNRDGDRVLAPPSAYRGPSAGRPIQDALLVSSLFPNGAVAKLRFEPRRPDELSVCPGDYLKVRTLFDDGWALCKDKSGKKGMVPTSCLRVNRARRIR